MSNVFSHTAVGAIMLESNANISPAPPPPSGLPSVTVWMVASSFVHVTVVPEDMVISDGT